MFPLGDSGCRNASFVNLGSWEHYKLDHLFPTEIKSKKLAELNIHCVYKVNLATPPYFSFMPTQLLSITEMIITFKNDLSLR